MAHADFPAYRDAVMLSKDSFNTERQPSPAGGADQAAIGDEGEKKKNRVAGLTGNKTRIEQAEARTEQAEARTEQAEARTEQAETRTEQAKTRAESAETRTEQAETRTELAKTRTEQAEIRTEQAETRTEQAETTLQRVVRSGVDLRQEISTRLLKNITLDGIADGKSPLKDLTGRQREILQLIAEGQNTKQIAEMLKVSPKTVEYHRMKLMNCLNIHDVPGLVRFAMKAGLLPQEN
jgi:DNA-binding CsgD family transcriptional regulator